MALKSDVERQLKEMITRGGMPDSMRIASALSKIPAAIERGKEAKIANYSREQSILNTFETRLNNPINNAYSDSTIYSNKTLDEIEAKWDRMYSEDIRRFPNQQAEITDIYESKKVDLNKKRSLNNHYNYLSSKIPDAKNFLVDMAEKLSTMSWEELTPEAKIELEKELRDGTQNIATLSKMIANNQEYFQNHETFNRDADDIQIGIIGGYNQLLSQIDTIDPDGNIISKADLDAMLATVRENRPEKMAKINELNVGFKTARVTGNAKDFDKAHAEWKGLSAYSTDPTFSKEYADKMGEYEAFLDDLKSKLSKKTIEKAEYDRLHTDYLNDPFKWASMHHLDKATGQGIDVRTVGMNMQKLQEQMDTIDADYVQDTGNEYSKWRGRSTPWRDVQEEPFTPTFTGELGETDEIPEFTKEDIARHKENLRKHRVAIDKDSAAKRVGEGATIKPPPIDYSGETVERNNPGNLRFANQTYATGKDSQGFAVFETAKHGWQALYNQIDLDKTRDLTLEKFINKYAPPSENDTTSYLRNVQQQLKVAPNTNINDINTKKLAIAIAKQEGYIGEPPIEKKIKGGEQLTKVRDGKTVVNYDVADTHSFKKAQVNLKDIASNKFKSLSKDNKKNYGNVRDFVKAKYKDWLKRTGKYGKGAWYTEGDFKYFFPTKVSPKGITTNISGIDIYDLFDRRLNMHPAFKKVVALPAATVSPSYEKFAKDFDDFRKYLQES